MVANAILKILHEISLPDRLKKKKKALLTGSPYLEKDNHLSQSIHIHSTPPPLSLSFSLSVKEATKKNGESSRD